MSFPVLLGLVGCVVDFGWTYWKKMACGTAATSAAIGAVVAANAAANQSCGSGTTHWNCSAYTCPSTLSKDSIASDLDNGCLYAKQNGFTNSGRQTVTLVGGTGNPPAASTISTMYYVTATVSERVPTLFSAVLGGQWMQVSAQSTAAIIPSGGCIYVLDPTAIGALTMKGNAGLSSGCGVYVNSSATGAISMVGGSTITTAYPPATTDVVGTVSYGSNTSITPAPIQVSRWNPADPFAGNMPTAPTAGSCQPSAQFSGSGSNTIQPGTYCDEVRQTGSGTLVLSSGTYYLENGITSGGTSTVTSTGPVTLYLAGGGVSFAGSGGTGLNPPSSGNYRGIVIWQPASNTSSSTIVGTSTQYINGLIYMPSAALAYTGTSSSIVSTIVVDTLSMVGTSNLKAAASTPWAGDGPGGTFIIQ